MLSNSWQSSHSVTWARNILASLCFWFWIDFWLVHFQKPYWTATFLSNPHIWLLGPHVESWPTVYEDTLQTTLGAEMRSGLCNLLPGNQRRKKKSGSQPNEPRATNLYKHVPWVIPVSFLWTSSHMNHFDSCSAGSSYRVVNCWPPNIILTYSPWKRPGVLWRWVLATLWQVVSV